MGYIGTDINYGNLAFQTGTGDGSDTTPIATLSYTVPTSASIQVHLDGVTQVPDTDYTASGTTLTFTTAPVNLVKILVYFLGRSLDMGTPAAGTVTNASVDASAAIATSKLSGAVTSIPSHGLATSATTDTTNAGNIASGTLAVARGGTGATTHTLNNVMVGAGTSALTSVAPSTSGNVLTSNGSTWASTAPAGGGFTLKGSPVATTSGSNIDVSGFPAEISVLVIGFMGVGFAAKAQLNVHLGTASGLVDGSGYQAGSVQLRESAHPDSVDSTSGFTINEHHSSSAPIHGQMIITRMNTSNAWTASWSMYLHTYEVVVGGGYHSGLGGEFTQLRLRGGGNTFNAGSVNFAYI